VLPYGPDLNFVQNAFSKPKASMPGSAERATTALKNAFARLLDKFAPAECANSCAANGYDQE
jgi:hypothetical protein